MLSQTEEIKSKLDIVDIIAEYFPLKASGVNYKARCPFHDEKTPSFMVNRERQFFHCFGCNKSGDIFTFLMEMEKIEFPEALKILAAKAGVKLNYQDSKTTSLKTKIMDINEAAADFFQYQLLNAEAGKKALSYLKEKRKLKDETIKEWRLGYALDSWEAAARYLKSKNFIDQEILASGLVAVKPSGRDFYDRFRDRIIFPIADYHGNLVGFTGRAMKDEESAKYINTPQTLIYNKSEVIFGLFKAKEEIKAKDKVVIVEGNMDVISSHEAGVKNAVAVSGTALTEEQLRILKRLTSNIIFAFDADEAGIRAAERSITLAWQSEVNVRVAAIGRNLAKDPDELIKKDVNAWLNLIEAAPAAMDYFFQVNLKKYQPGEVESKKEIAKTLLNYIIKLANPVEEDYYLKKLSEAIQVGELPLREAINKARNKEIKKYRNKEIDSPTGAINKSEKKEFNKKISAAERLLAALLIDVHYLEAVSDDLKIEYLPRECQEFYKMMVVYYTKGYQVDDSGQSFVNFMEQSKPDLAVIFNRLILLRDEIRRLTENETAGEIKKILVDLKNNYIREKSENLQRELKAAEESLPGLSDDLAQEKTRARIQELTIELNNLSQERKDN